MTKYIPKHKVVNSDGTKTWKPDKVVYDPKTGSLKMIRKGTVCSYWSNQMISDLKRYFATTKNKELAGILGVSERTVSRKARELGLEKDPQWLKAVWDEHRLMAHVVSKSLGYPGAFEKGKPTIYAFQKGERTYEQVLQRINAQQ